MIPKLTTALVVSNQLDLDQIDFEDFLNPLQENEKMNFLKHIGSFIKEIFSEDYDTEGLITPFGIIGI